MIETQPLIQSRPESPELCRRSPEGLLEHGPSVERRQAAFRFRLIAFVRFPGQPSSGTSTTRTTTGGDSTATGSNSSPPFKAKG